MNTPSISPSTIASLALVPVGVRAVLLIRHAERPEIPLGSFGPEVDITSNGALMAEKLGEHLALHRPGRLLASPLVRCLNTARAIARGAGWPLAPEPDVRLASPFIANTKLAINTYATHGLAPIVNQQLREGPPPAGFRSTSEGMAIMVEAMMEGPANGPCLDVLVTHDANLAVVVGRWLGATFDEASWPGFLDGMFAWRCAKCLNVAWRGAAFQIE